MYPSIEPMNLKRDVDPGSLHQLEPPNHVPLATRPPVLVITYPSCHIFYIAIKMTDLTQEIIVDSEPKLISLLDKLSSIQPPTTPLSPPSLYLDIEGQNLGRHGKISILSVFIYPGNEVYLIDVHTLQDNAFTTTNEQGSSLKSVLESSEVPKGFFDIRNDSDALFSLFGIKVAGIHDLQLMELACRQGSRRRVSGLAKCIEIDLAGGPDQAAAARTLRAKQDGKRIWDPQHGGTHAAFNTRPMPPAVAEYCSADVAMLPSLWKAYIRKIGSDENMFWRREVRLKTLDRIKESQKATYNPQGGDKSFGPSEWQPGALEELRDSWNENLLDDIRTGDSYKELSFGEVTVA
jgi:exonuclease 3'-5' domain-containing protein 1